MAIRRRHNFLLLLLQIKKRSTNKKGSKGNMIPQIRPPRLTNTRSFVSFFRN